MTATTQSAKALNRPPTVITASSGHPDDPHPLLTLTLTLPSSLSDAAIRELELEIRDYARYLTDIL